MIFFPSRSHGDENENKLDDNSLSLSMPLSFLLDKTVDDNSTAKKKTREEIGDTGAFLKKIILVI